MINLAPLDTKIMGCHKNGKTEGGGVEGVGLAEISVITGPATARLLGSVFIQHPLCQHYAEHWTHSSFSVLTEFVILTEKSDTEQLQRQLFNSNFHISYAEVVGSAM